MYGKKLSDFPERFDEFLDEFKDADPDALDAAFQAARGACTEFPTPGDVRRQLKQRQESQDKFSAEKAWQVVLTIFEKHWYPDTGVGKDAPELDAAAEYALRQIGGYPRLHSVTLDNFSFARRDFFEAYKRHRETGGFLAPTRAEAAALLNAIRQELPE